MNFNISVSELNQFSFIKSQSPIFDPPASGIFTGDCACAKTIRRAIMPKQYLWEPSRLTRLDRSGTRRWHAGCQYNSFAATATQASQADFAYDSHSKIFAPSPPEKSSSIKSR